MVSWLNKAVKGLSLPLHRVLLGCGLAILAGCSQMQQPGYYNPPKPSSQTDAVDNAEALYTQQTVRAPSQIQFAIKKPMISSESISSVDSSTQGTTTEGNLGDSQKGSGAGPVDSEQIMPIGASPQAKLIPIAQTFAGTFPCFRREMNCTAQRITLTLAPNGRWRARATYLDQALASGKPLVEQGCWRTFTQQYPHIILLDETGNARADLAMTANNTLQLRSLNGQTPNLTYTITRQPDVDPIAELDNTPAPKCND